VNTTGAVIIGVLAGIIPFIAVSYLKKILGFDDALDTWGVHGVGGTLGALMTGILADEKVNSVVAGVKDGLVFSQIKAIIVTMILSIVMTAIAALIVKAVLGLRANEEVETVGLDLAEHGEEGYHA
jgi:Amt family ammonium transporter